MDSIVQVEVEEEEAEEDGRLQNQHVNVLKYVATCTILINIVNERIKCKNRELNILDIIYSHYIYIYTIYTLYIYNIYVYTHTHTQLILGNFFNDFNYTAVSLFTYMCVHMHMNLSSVTLLMCT